ncbi:MULTISPECIES: gas vesicle protein GvpO [Thermomonospora]|uniref:Gas vesicle protein GvpO n=1 Tax=Thermomonospora cellulosilytica TaxID=1411118 RepID=A0A7W3R873_9ACTN|nr:MULTISPECIES: gas vesicle protein GvpO [Thermomonospora]MBA9004018.1 hypothetical protein [Thermomonospora cellulosilytica]
MAGTLARAAREAIRQVEEMTGRQVEGVTATRRTENGWVVDVEVVETRRIPDTADMLAVYQVELDGDGEVTGYRRARRYQRGRADDD